MPERVFNHNSSIFPSLKLGEIEISVFITIQAPVETWKVLDTSPYGKNKCLIPADCALTATCSYFTKQYILSSYVVEIGQIPGT